MSKKFRQRAFVYAKAVTCPFCGVSLLESKLKQHRASEHLDIDLARFMMRIADDTRSGKIRPKKLRLSIADYAPKLGLNTGTAALMKAKGGSKRVGRVMSGGAFELGKKR